MCLAMPAKIITIISDEKALIELGGVQKEISTILINDLVAGDYVIIHVGYALTKLNEDEALKTLHLFSEMQQQGPL